MLAAQPCLPQTGSQGLLAEVLAAPANSICRQQATSILLVSTAQSTLQLQVRLLLVQMAPGNACKTL